MVEGSNTPEASACTAPGALPSQRHSHQGLHHAEKETHTLRQAVLCRCKPQMVRAAALCAVLPSRLLMFAAGVLIWGKITIIIKVVSLGSMCCMEVVSITAW